MTTKPPGGGLIAAARLLTAVPLPGVDEAEDRGGVSAWFPAIGAVFFGIPVATVVLAFEGLLTALGSSAGLDAIATLAAALVVVAWAAMSRLLHWDGLADVADAWWGGGDTQTRLMIMKDSATGAFGATTIALAAIVQVSALASVVRGPAWLLVPVLVATPVFGRLAATFGTWFGRPVSDAGLAARYNSRPSFRSAIPVLLAIGIATSIPLLLSGFLNIDAWAGLCLWGVLSAAVIPHLIALRFGGVTGDTLGASVVLTEAALLVGAAIIGVV